MKIYGKKITKEALLKRVGDFSQVGQIKFYEFSEGKSKGVRAADIKTPAGVDMTIVLDRAMDISSLTYKNIPIAWRSATRETSPMFFENKGAEWLRTFFGGLLTTCGLENVGAACVDQDQEFGLHGRIANMPAENISYNINLEGDSPNFVLKGKVRQAKVFGENLELNRKITSIMDKPKIIIEDEVTNIGFDDTPIMILYHINIGYPIIDQDSRLIESKAKVKPRDEEAKKGFNSFYNFGPPVKNFKEQVYFHDISADSSGNANVAIINEQFNNNKGIGVWLKYNKNNLPYLIQWKQLGEGEYVCGIEPSNSFALGRKSERKNESLKFIKPNQTVKYKLELNILKSKNDIENLKKVLNS